MPWCPRLSTLILLAWLAGCSSPKGRTQSHAGTSDPTPGFGQVDPQTLGSRTLTVGMEDMPPGDSIGVHKHLQEDEVVFVHRGEVLRVQHAGGMPPGAAG